MEGDPKMELAYALCYSIFLDCPRHLVRFRLLSLHTLALAGTAGAGL